MRVGVCLWCGNEAIRVRHHPTGDLDGHYFDPQFIVGICRPCHVVEHQAWRRVGIADITDPLIARVIRLAWFAGKTADVSRSIGPRELRGMNRSLMAALQLVEGKG